MKKVPIHNMENNEWYGTKTMAANGAGYDGSKICWQLIFYINNIIWI